MLSWLLPLLALLIKLSSTGPVFFLQKRTGRGGKSFTCYKLRTLAHNPAAHTKRMDVGEETATALGRFLRQTNLDELPQFFNVLAGSMSLVGPRPHMHADCNAFSALIPRYKFRNLVKPGITGLAQVKGYHGKVISLECIYKRYEWDAWYVQYAGFGLDLKIIAKTAWQTALTLIGKKKNKRSGQLIPITKTAEISCETMKREIVFGSALDREQSLLNSKESEEVSPG